ncbi:centrosomal protein of 55 kDa [Astyanax mexicanus]|uniref:Centrosomal protein of 55 kDa n=2 Tax=Astyanax mexicanus TaxID=7994 RepID=A0A8T2L5W3_ASTMX|nr:centrosomal protein of 55 kDa [Astyanax mexicanus]
MAAKGAKGIIANKLGFKNSGSKSVESELEKLKKENAQLKKTLDEISKQNRPNPHPHHDSDKASLLERTAYLESLRQKNTQQLLDKEQEIAALRQQLRTEGGELVASLQNQLEKDRNEAKQKEEALHALSQETEDLKNKLLAVSQRCEALQKHNTDIQGSTGELVMVQEQLRDALEKNQQWLVYDQQREAYVQGVLARMAELEQQLSHSKEAKSEAKDRPRPSSGRDQEQVLPTVQRELDEKQEQVDLLQAEMEKLRVQCEDRRWEAVQLKEELREKQRSSRQLVAEEKALAAEHRADLQKKLEAANARLEEERKRAAELLLQVNQLQNSLLKQNEEQKRIAILEQQVQMSAKDFENEKLDRQSLQHQLRKVLKELRKARDQITRLESTKEAYGGRDAEYCILPETSPTKTYNALDESYLECPNCRTSYPTSQHRELLMHLDYCFG